jgi:hypothetical protein
MCIQLMTGQQQVWFAAIEQWKDARHRFPRRAQLESGTKIKSSLPIPPIAAAIREILGAPRPE